MADHSYLIVFRSRLRPGVEAEYARRAEAIYEIAATMPGMLRARDYVGEDGERISVVEFDTAENLARWREHPEHVRAQQEGRERFYATYEIQICRIDRASRFTAPA